MVEKLQGIKKGQVPDRTEWCVQRVEDSMGFGAGRFFVQQTFGGESRARGIKVIEGMYFWEVMNDPIENTSIDIITAFKESLKNLSWMDKESATAAAEKVRSLIVTN